MPPSKSKQLALFVLLASAQAARAQETPANGMTAHLDTLWLVLYILGGLLVALVVWEILDRPRAVRLDASLSAPPEIDNDYVDPTKIKFAEPARPAAPPSFSPPPPAAEPMRAAAPPPSSEGAHRMPSPPPPSSGDEDNPFRKLSKLGSEDDSPLATPRPPMPATTPAATPPSMVDSGSSSGGWADLLQRVRAGEPSSEDSGKISTSSLNVSAPRTEEEAPSSSAAWESLLKKSATDLTAPDVTTIAGDFQPRGAIKLGLGGGDEEKAPVDPLRMALDNPSTDPDENLPDFVKKATRTIALDLKKGGEQTPPPPMPKTEG